ncbi:MAG TPA: hypothetical protein VNL15_06010, partial [Dehalococcoidia bacterium]|nr:hypothetical protein [Dehalococcoidia bacterium]
SPRMNQYPPLHVLSSDSRQAMEWIKHNVPEDSAFLVITGQYGWWGDAENEWFPLLAGRQSLDTVQGYEWVPDDKFLEMIDEYYYLQSCAWDDVSCLDDWAYDTGKNFSHVYISAGADTWSDSYCCWWLRSSLLNSPRYEIVYNNDSVTIFSLREEFRGQHYRYSSSYSYQSDYGSLPYSSSGDGSSGFPSYP